MGLITKLFGTTSEREVKKLRSLVDQIEALEPSAQALSDEALRAKTAEFKARLPSALWTRATTQSATAPKP